MNFKFFQNNDEPQPDEDVERNNILWQRIDYLQNENERLRERIQELIIALVDNPN